ncbi:hypothetical protein ACLOJK_012645 [Asimina triloba]
MLAARRSELPVAIAAAGEEKKAGQEGIMESLSAAMILGGEEKRQEGSCSHIPHTQYRGTNVLRTERLAAFMRGADCLRNKLQPMLRVVHTASEIRARINRLVHTFSEIRARINR